MSVLTQQLVDYVYKHIMNQVDKNITKRQLETHAPQFAQSIFILNLSMLFQAMASDPQAKTLSGMKQQKTEDVRKLQKDNMIPLLVQNQQQIKTYTKDALTINKQQSIKTKSLSKASQKRNLDTPSVSMSVVTKRSNATKINSKRKKQQSTFISLCQYQDDQIQAKFRKRKQAQIQQRENSIKSLTERQKNLEIKKQNFLKEQENKQYTFDFDGEAINHISNQTKMRYYQMNLKFAGDDKKLKSNINFMPSAETNQIKIQTKKSFQLDQPSMSLQLTSIPMFKTKNGNNPQKSNQTTLQSQKRYRNQYKKRFGGRFTRLSQNLDSSINNTIDVITQRSQTELNKILSQRRYFKDDQKSINQSMVSYRTRIDQATKRKLALPKLNGKYSTLDRYQYV